MFVREIEFDMKWPEETTLYFAPDAVLVEAQITLLSNDRYDSGMGEHWWEDPALDETAAKTAIDLNWSWFDPVDLNGQDLRSIRVAIVTGDDQVQGAMVVSTDLVASILHPDERCLYVDQLCTAPRNRPLLRRDRGSWYKGVGTKLLQCAARLSLELGGDGKLHLLASPEGEPSYQKLGFENLKLAPHEYDCIKYTPMELPLSAVPDFLQR